MQRLANLFFLGIGLTLFFPGQAQTYDQLKVQLQFENFYGSKYRSTIRSEEITGSEFLFDDWLPAEITLPNGTVAFDQAKINLYLSAAEVIYKDQEKLISTEHLKLVAIPGVNRWFVPGSKHQYKGISMLGFLELFEPDPKPPFILVHHYVYIREPNSDGYANAGNLTKKLVKASNTYLYDGTELTPIKGKKDVEKFYAENKTKFSQLTGQLDTNFRDPKSIHVLVNAMR